MLLKFLVSIGCGFDCASKGEIKMALSAGASPSAVIYAHPVKPRSYLRFAASVSVDLMTFDSDHELVKIRDVYPSARLLIRIKTPEVPCFHPLSDKFGCKMEEVRHLLQLARTLQLIVVGVSFHVGSLCEQPDVYATAIRMSREVFDIAGEVGFNFKLLDIGGGFQGVAGSLPLFDKIAFYINQGLEECFPKGCGVEIIAEPGHYVVDSAYVLCMKIIGKKTQIIKDTGHNGPQKKKHFYYMNDGEYFSFDTNSENPYMEPFLGRKEAAGRKAWPCKLWGVSLTPDEIIEGHAPEMEEGEHMIFLNMGGYTFCLASRFNGFPLPILHHVFSEHSWYEEPGDLPLEDFLKDLNLEQLKAFQEFRESIQETPT